MQQYAVRVAEVSSAGGLIAVRCAGPAGAVAPGQFCLAAAGAGVRQPIFPRSGGPGLEFMVRRAHPCAGLRPGDALDLIGPCGRGFDLPVRAARLLVLADRCDRLWPLISHAVERGWEAAVLPAPGAQVPPLPLAVEILSGPLTAEAAAWADLIALDLDDPAAAARRARALCPLRPAAFVQAVRVPCLPCGTGACQACWVQLLYGRRLACVDGPVLAY